MLLSEFEYATGHILIRNQKHQLRNGINNFFKNSIEVIKLSDNKDSCKMEIINHREKL